VVIGRDASFSSIGANSIAIGFESVASGSNTVRLGNSSITSIGGYANWTNVSDGRIKTDVRENVVGLSFINKLRPVTYHLDQIAIRNLHHLEIRDEHQHDTIVRSGFIAQEVQQAAEDNEYHFSGVDIPESESDLYGLRYAEFVVPLVKAVQELSASNDALRNMIEDLRQENQEIRSSLNALLGKTKHEGS
jgi:hypothetical protein